MGTEHCQAGDREINERTKLGGINFGEMSDNKREINKWKNRRCNKRRRRGNRRNRW